MKTSVSHKEFWPSTWLFPRVVSNSSLCTQLRRTDNKITSLFFIWILQFYPKTSQQHTVCQLKVKHDILTILTTSCERPRISLTCHRKTTRSANAVIMPVNSSLRRRVTSGSQQYAHQWHYMSLLHWLKAICKLAWIFTKDMQRSIKLSPGGLDWIKMTERDQTHTLKNKGSKKSQMPQKFFFFGST